MTTNKIVFIALLFVFGLVGLVLAGGRGFEGFDFCTEGPLYKGKSKIVHTIAGFECVDYETFFCEGPRAGNCTVGQKTILPASLLVVDFNCEGPSYKCPDYEEVDLFRVKALDAMPAAGSH